MVFDYIIVHINSVKLNNRYYLSFVNNISKFFLLKLCNNYTFIHLLKLVTLFKINIL